jgi:hexulose-6-phosphate isomerase
MSPEPPEFLHPRPGGFSRRDLIRTGALAGTAAAALAPFRAGAQEAAGTTASKPDERRSSPKAYPKLKKSINLWAFPYPSRMTLRECLQLAKDAGFDGVELNYDLESDLSPKSGRVHRDPQDGRRDRHRHQRTLQLPLLALSAHQQ